VWLLGYEWCDSSVLQDMTGPCVAVRIRMVWQ